MKENAQPSAGESKPVQSFVDTGLFDALSIGLTGASAMVGAWYSAARNFNNRILESMGIVRDIKHIRDKELHKIGHQVLRSNGVNPKGFGKIEPLPMDLSEDVVGRTRKIWKDYHIAKDARLAEHHLGNWWQKWMALDKHGKAESAVVALAAASAAIGAVVTYAGISRQSAKQNELLTRVDALEDDHRQQRG